MSSASSALQLRHCSAEMISQSTLPEFLFLYQSEQFFLKQLGVSSIKELIDNIDRVTDAVKQCSGGSRGAVNPHMGLSYFNPMYRRTAVSALEIANQTIVFTGKVDSDYIPDLTILTVSYKVN